MLNKSPVTNAVFVLSFNVKCEYILPLVETQQPVFINRDYILLLF